MDPDTACLKATKIFQQTTSVVIGALRFAGGYLYICTISL